MTDNNRPDPRDDDADQGDAEKTTTETVEASKTTEVVESPATEETTEEEGGESDDATA